MDLISRQTALDAFGLSEKTRKYGGDHSGYDTMMLYEIQDILEVLPSAEPERDTGKWIVSDDKYWHICPFCGADIDVNMGTGVYVDGDEVSHANYCPNCGAKMEV